MNAVSGDKKVTFNLLYKGCTDVSMTRIKLKSIYKFFLLKDTIKKSTNFVDSSVIFSLYAKTKFRTHSLHEPTDFLYFVVQRYLCPLAFWASFSVHPIFVSRFFLEATFVF